MDYFKNQFVFESVPTSSLYVASQCFHAPASISMSEAWGLGEVAGSSIPLSQFFFSQYDHVRL